MLSITDLRSLSRARLKDAEALLSKKRHDGAAYLAGYAVEIALKARIVKTLRWPGFPATGTEFSGLQSFRSHDLDILLSLSGWEPKIRTKYLAKWSIVSQWDPESRYLPPGSVAPAEAQKMVETAADLVGVLI